MNEQTITLDISKRPSIVPVLYIRQGDKSGTQLTVNVTKNDTAYSLSGKSVRFCMRAPKGLGYYEVDGTVSGNTASFTIDETYAGNHAGTTDVAYVDILQGTSVIESTANFRVVILENAEEGADPNGAWKSGITEAVEAANTAVERANAAAEAVEDATDAANQAAADASAAADDAAAAATSVDEATEAARAAASSAQASSSAASSAASQAAEATTRANEAADNAADMLIEVSDVTARAERAIDAMGDISELAVPLMTTDTRGGAMLGDGLKVDDGKLSVDASHLAGFGLTAHDGKLHVDSGVKLPKFDQDAGRYDNASLKAWLDYGRDGLVYSALIPKYDYSTTPACEQADANAGLVCEPSTVYVAGRDDYAHKGPFETWEVNGGANDDGSPFTTAFRDFGDSAFSRYGDNGDVWMMRRVLWYRYDWDYSETHAKLSVCDTERAGFRPQPGALLPDGTVRPYMLYSKYPGVMYGGKYASVSGVKAANRTVSHNSLIPLAAAKGAGYSGKSVAHDWIDKVDMLLIHGSKSSQAVFAGCSGYTLQCFPTVAETGVRRVVVSNANAASIEVGSAMMLGNQATSTADRNNASCYNVFDGLTVTRKEPYDASNTAVYFDADADFDVDTTYRLSTAPWPSGSLDGVLGYDGTITAAGRTNSREPFLLRGRECMVGFYECLSGVIVNAEETDGELRCELHVAYDTADDATSLTSGFTDTGVSLPTSDAAGWLYTRDIADAGGLLVGVGQGATTSTGVGDGSYQNVATSKGLREFLGLGDLGVGGFVGLFCVASHDGLGVPGWVVGSRLSATGRSGVN